MKVENSSIIVTSKTSYVEIFFKVRVCYFIVNIHSACLYGPLVISSAFHVIPNSSLRINSNENSLIVFDSVSLRFQADKIDVVSINFQAYDFLIRMQYPVALHRYAVTLT